MGVAPANDRLRCRSQLLPAFLVLVMTLGVARTLEAQGDLRGRVLDAATRQPIASAHVSAVNAARAATSDSLGRFAFTGLSAGEQLLVVRMTGYVTDSVRIVVGDDEVIVRDFLVRRSTGPAPRVTSIAAPSGRPRLHISVTGLGGQPVPYANVGVNGVRRMADDSGRLAIDIAPPQRLVLDVRRIGFRPRHVEVDAIGDSTVAIELEPSVQHLAGSTITAAQPRKSLELSGFYRRSQDREKGINAGTFLTEEDIERRNPHRITQMFEGLPSVAVRKKTAGCLTDHDRRCWAPVGRGNCAMTVYLDGRRLNSIRVRDELAYAVGMDEIVLPTHVAGIEVYASAGRAPPEYQSLAGFCGVILLWTK